MNPLELKRRASRGLSSRIERPIELPRRVVKLTNGRYEVQLSGIGTGVSQCAGLAVSRWVPDLTSDVDGFHVYLRDIDSGAVWSAGFQPTQAVPDEYEFSESPGIAEIRRVDDEIECRMSVCVAPNDDYELRVCRITNFGDRPRRIELTSYVEFVLTTRAMDESHPTFFKLFVETEFVQSQNAIFARRRPRSSTESEQWACHRLLTGDGNGGGHEVQFETNRARFIGRGRSLARPRALDVDFQLTGDKGAVLDPVGSLRTTVMVQPGETRVVPYLLGAASSHREIEEIAERVNDLEQVEAVLASAARASSLQDSAGQVERPDWPDGSASRRPVIHAAHLSPPSPHVKATGIASGTPERPPTSDGNGHKAPERLLFENSFGGFTADGREYVIRLLPDGNGGHELPPRPWVNVIANEQAGFLVSERGAGYSWVGNSRENRLTAWHNDAVCDPHSEAFWIRDDEDGAFWSLTPGPTPAAVPYEVRHGFGYTTFCHTHSGLECELTLFMAPQEPVKLARVRVTNRGRSARRLSLFSYLRWNLGLRAADAIGSFTTEHDANLAAILARNPDRKQFGKGVAFSAIAMGSANVGSEVSFSVDREAFLGQLGQQESPAAIANGKSLDGHVAKGIDPCAAWQVPIELAAGASFECTFLLGEGADYEATAELIRNCRTTGESQRLLERAKEFWRQTLSTIQVETPEPEIDLLVNGWLSYQNLSCRMWGRSAFYQPGGAFGFRDQLQDSAALLFQRPDLTRQQILRHASQQFMEGDVLHFWHPGSGSGLRTRFSDDLLWLPYITATYVGATGDKTVLDELAPFIHGAALLAGQQEAYIDVEPTVSTASVYEHSCMAIDRGLTTGPHGLPLIGCGDWNDGMNRVGTEGRGESVWLGFFVASLLELFIPICSEQDDYKRVERYTRYRAQLVAALEKSGWDGAWYRRAYYDDGEPLGSASCDECRIDAIAQAWAVLSGVAAPQRIDLCIAAVERCLVDDSAGIIRLLTPPFNRTSHDPGYIKGYLPGIRENGGQYTHGVLWFVRALAELGHGSRAVELLKMLSPISHTASADAVAIYQTEPYVVAADVYGAPPHVGRGGWTWYTGSAGWMYRTAVESVLGFSIERGEWLVIRPAISASWPCCRLTYRLPGSQTQYDIAIENPEGKEHGVTSAELDGALSIVADGAARVALVDDGKVHRVVVRL